MQFEHTDQEKAFRETAKAFTLKNIAPHAAKWDAEAYFPIDVIKSSGETGFCGMYCAEADGGIGASRLEAAIVIEEMARACPSTAAYISIHNMVAWMVSTWATLSAKQKYMTGLSSGKMLGSYCLTEPSAGSDAASLKTRAEKVPGGWRVTGAKAFISGAGATDVLVVMARTGGEGPKGISALIIPSASEGISFGRKEEKMGWNSQPTRVINFENVFVPEENLLGQEGEGFIIAMKGLNGGRVNIAACSIGGAAAALDAARDYMKTRTQFKKTLADFQALQFKLADMATELEAAKLMVYRAASKIDTAAEDVAPAAAMAKRFATDVCFDIVDQALQLHGGYGYTKDYPVERLLRDLRVHRILEGTNEIMRLIIARHILEV